MQSYSMWISQANQAVSSNSQDLLERSTEVYCGAVSQRSVPQGCHYCFITDGVYLVTTTVQLILFMTNEWFVINQCKQWPPVWVSWGGIGCWAPVYPAPSHNIFPLTLCASCVMVTSFFPLCELCCQSACHIALQTILSLSCSGPRGMSTFSAPCYSSAPHLPVLQAAFMAACLSSSPACLCQFGLGHLFCYLLLSFLLTK